MVPMSISAMSQRRAHGMRVTAQVKLVVAEARKLRFELECRDEREIISMG